MLSPLQQHLKTKRFNRLLKSVIRTNSIFFASVLSVNLYAQASLSYTQAEKIFLQESYATKANSALQEASTLQAEAIKNLGLPVVDLNVRAYALHAKVDVPLTDLKNDINQTVDGAIKDELNKVENNIDQGLIGGLESIVDKGVNRAVGLIPNEYSFDFNKQEVTPTVSFLIPVYTGGIIKNTKEVANFNAERGKINTQQIQDTQRFEIIQAYFNAQLQKQLLESAHFNFQAMQKHYHNALRLEQQGFLSKGQRMQFEVARNTAQRMYHNTETVYKSSLFSLNNLLQTMDVTDLSTPLFVNTTQTLSLNNLLKTFPEQSALIQKLQKDTQIAGANVKLQQAAKKPKVFAFGEYTLDDKQDWIVGVAASYNLFSGIDKSKNIKAAELQHQAAQLLTARSKQEIENIIYASYSEAVTAQQSDSLLQNSIKAAKENLRIQELSFKEDMGTATQVIDAQNELNIIKAETALNAYKYVMSLATLLQSHGSIQQFQSYLIQPNTRFIR